MHNEDISPREEDRQVQCAILATLLTEHPVLITKDELLSRLVLEDENFAETDAVERGVRDLRARGILHFVEDLLILPSLVIYLDGLNCF